MYRDDIMKIFNEVADILEKKHSDYGENNLLIHGLYGVAVRLTDKAMRLANLSFKEPDNDESIEDTLMDVIGYAVNALHLLRSDKLKKRGIISHGVKENGTGQRRGNLANT